MNIKVVKRPTQHDVAQLAGVSQGVVSVVLSNAAGIRLVLPETRHRVLSATRQLDYRVNLGARQLRLGSSNLVNILVPVRFSRWLRTLTVLLEETLARLQFRTMVSRLDADDAHIGDAIRDIMAMNFAGTIILDHFVSGSVAVPDSPVKLLQQYPHSIFLNHAPGLISDNCVDIDYAAGMEEAVVALHTAGRRRFALALNDNIHPPMRERRRGFVTGLTRCGIARTENMVWNADTNRLSGLEGALPEAVAEQIVADVVEKRHPDVLFASNDEWAIAIIKVLRRKHIRVPDDVAVVGYGDDHDLCWCSDPELASINHGNAELATKLAGRLLGSLDGMETDPQHQGMVRSFFVDRDSSGIRTCRISAAVPDCCP